MADDGDDDDESPKDRFTMMVLVSIANFCALSVWFSTTAVASALEEDKSYSESQVAGLLTAVQVGFVVGTVVLSVSNIGDLFPPRKVVVVASLAAAGLNLLTIPVTNYLLLWFVRFAVGCCMGSIYPPSMSVLSGWFVRGRGFALGTMVGALAVGSGAPHLLRSFLPDVWRWVVGVSSILAVVGSAIMMLLVRDGPHQRRAPRFQPRYVLRSFSERGPRVVSCLYYLHMTELYACWQNIGKFLEDRLDTGKDEARLVAFMTFLVGGAACAIAGAAAEVYGRTAVMFVCSLTSMAMAVTIGWVEDADAIVALMALVWGAAVISDSAQYSTAITELIEPEYRSSMLLFQTGLGYAVTVVFIQLVPVVKSAAGWGAAFSMLGAGPLLGTVGTLWLRRLPESTKLAHGRR